VFRGLRRDMYAALPDVECVGKPVKQNCFEITVDGELLYSGVETGRFPQMGDVVRAVTAVKTGQPVPAIGRQSGINQTQCSIM